MFGIPEWAFGIGTLIVLVAVLQVLLARLLPPSSRRRHVTDDQREILEDLQTRLGDVDALKQRLAELEERVDFAERLLAKQRDEQRLAPPS